MEKTLCASPGAGLACLHVDFELEPRTPKDTSVL
jgi:hypothetical protein